MPENEKNPLSGRNCKRLRRLPGALPRPKRKRRSVDIVPSGIWVDRKRWGKKNDINIPNIPGEERDALLAKRAKLKELVDVIEMCIRDRMYMSGYASFSGAA